MEEAKDEVVFEVPLVENTPEQRKAHTEHSTTILKRMEPKINQINRTLGNSDIIAGSSANLLLVAGGSLVTTGETITMICGGGAILVALLLRLIIFKLPPGPIREALQGVSDRVTEEIHKTFSKRKA